MQGHHFATANSVTSKRKRIHMRIASMSKKRSVVRMESLICSMQLLPTCDRRFANCSCSRLSDEIHSGEEHIGGILCQTPTSDTTREPDASATERGSELDEQICRLQSLVSHLLEKNEELRQRLARQASGKEGQRFIGQRSGVF